ncbi:hypothetical protein CLOSPO_00305 [Clostridium sporogenes ATCC 15579]|nr:hypothetical protein CLOSPO_00305 [Clostridium sporogenes ATCC 15579]
MFILYQCTTEINCSQYSNYSEFLQNLKLYKPLFFSFFKFII